MSLRGVCPCCYAEVSLDAMFSDQEARRALALIVQLPAGMQSVYVRYLGLFRGPGRAVSWSDVRRLTLDLATQVRARRAPVEVWAQAMEETLAQRGRPEFSVPLESHAYMLKVASRLATAHREVEERAAERAVQQARQQPRAGGVQSIGEALAAALAPAAGSAAGRAALDEMRRHLEGGDDAAG